MLASQLHYLTYQCTVQMHSTIASNFIALYKLYLGVVGGCDGDVQCTIENVHVECGGQGGKQHPGVWNNTIPTCEGRLENVSDIF